MAANHHSVDKEVGQLLQIPSATAGDWYEVMGATGIEDSSRKRFNHAFESFIAGSYHRAYKDFVKLAGGGCAVSQYYLGLMHIKGTGVLQDYCRAHLWLNVASAQGHHKARIQLEKLTRIMSPNQVAEAQKLARAWMAKRSKSH
ncbi:MAG: hypothetical protein OES20_08540 [Gammaproteobacteria bacterium]|nr:hypothetical protein [Gammaproteobacteria bacterium]MDH3859928.1 hypothetical protein [Gammaproteobacteria bacterium]